MKKSRIRARTAFNGKSHGQHSHITEGHKEVFMAMTSGAPNFCLTSMYVNGKPAVAIVLVGAESPDQLSLQPCFVSITPGMILRSMDGEEMNIEDG